jgi:hypothetical protein
MQRKQAGLVIYKKGVNKAGDILELQVSEYGLVTFLSPSRQSVLCSREGVFIPPDDIISLDPVEERSYILFYRNMKANNFNIVVSRRKKKEGGGGEDWDAVFIQDAKVDSSDMIVGYGGDVFPFSVPLIALRKAIKEYNIYTIRYVLENVKDTVWVK